MGYVNSSPDDEYRLMSVAAANPVTELTPEHWYDGLAGAVPRGVAGAGLKAFQAFNDIADPIDEFLGRDEYLKEKGLDLPKSWEEYAKPDARWQGAPARVLQGVTEGLGLAAAGAAMGGPVGAATMLGGVEGDATYHEQVAAGVDHSTAMKVAGITGAVNALGVFLPMSVSKSAVMGLMGKGMQAEVAGNETLARMLYGAAEVAAPAAGKISTAVNVGVTSNLTFGMGQRALTGDILRENGYPELADQYKTFDTESVMADVVLGAAFGAFAHYSDPHAVPPSDIDGAMAVKKQEHYDNAGLGIHTDPLAVAAHDTVLSRSIEDLVFGKDPSLSADEAETLTRDILPDPTIEAAMTLQHEALAEAFDAHHELGALDRLPEVAPPEPVEPIAPAAEAPTPAAPQAEAPKIQMNEMARETMAQLAGSNPDLMLTLGDGREVRMADLPTILQEHATMAEKDSVLHDVAASCYIRTTL